MYPRETNFWNGKGNSPERGKVDEEKREGRKSRIGNSKHDRRRREYWATTRSLSFSIDKCRCFVTLGDAPSVSPCDTSRPIFHIGADDRSYFQPTFLPKSFVPKRDDLKKSARAELSPRVRKKRVDRSPGSMESLLRLRESSIWVGAF